MKKIVLVLLILVSLAVAGLCGWETTMAHGYQTAVTYRSQGYKVYVGGYGGMTTWEAYDKDGRVMDQWYAYTSDPAHRSSNSRPRSYYDYFAQ